MKQIQTKINVIPAPTNDGVVFVIMEKRGFFWKKIGQCDSISHLDKFSKQYVLKTGTTLEELVL